MKYAFLVAVALACAPACQVVGQRLGQTTHFDFESDPIGAAPVEFVSTGGGWCARVETGQAATGWRSVRLFPQRDLDRDRRGDLSVTLDAVPFRGQIVRLSGALRVDASAAHASSMRLFVRVERDNGRTGLNDAMGEAPVHATEWTPVDIVGAVSDDALTITIGAQVEGPGPFHLDDLVLESMRGVGVNDSRLLELVSERQLSNPDVQVARVHSPLLSRFYGRDIHVDAGVIVPPEPIGGEMAACYQIADFGGSWTSAYTDGAVIAAKMRQQYPRMLYVFLQCGGAPGHHAFADSVNDGPWGEALVNEIIPAIESRYLAGRAPRCRYVTGHGAGGWSALWLQVAYPHLFNGAWATSPEPLDFRAFYGTDIYAERTMRRDKCPLAENENGPRLIDFESQFSPRGDDGRPMHLCSRLNDAIDSAVAQSWRKYDIGAILNERWEALGPKLAGRLHIWCGRSDDDGGLPAVMLLKKDLERLKADADIILVDDRGHDDLADPHEQFWPFGAQTRIHREMAARTAAIARP